MEKKINSGGCFESLIHAILYAEDRSVILFGRPGRDSGQDARSGDGTIVYQAKFRQKNETICSLEKTELKRIKEYRQAGHPNFKHWKHASQWILATNIEINPNDHANWNSEIKLFEGENIQAEYWSGEIIRQKTLEHEHIRRVFLEGENRCLYGLKEAYDMLTSNRLDAISYAASFVERESEVKKIMDFISADDSMRFFRVTGPGGSGKTRLLYETLIIP